MNDLTDFASQHTLATSLGELTWLVNIARKWDKKMYLYPVPETDRQLNPQPGQHEG